MKTEYLEFAKIKNSLFFIFFSNSRNQISFIYNSVKSESHVNREIMFTVKSTIIRSECLNSKLMFQFNNLDDTHMSTKCSQTGKTDAIDVSLKSDAIIYSTALFKLHLSILLNSIITHGYMPDDFIVN